MSSKSILVAVNSNLIELNSNERNINVIEKLTDSLLLLVGHIPQHHARTEQQQRGGSLAYHPEADWTEHHYWLGRISQHGHSRMQVLGNVAVGVIPRPYAVEIQEKAPRFWSQSVLPYEIEHDGSEETEQRVTYPRTQPARLSETLFLRKE
jgi:hypothetical protein